MSLSSSLFTGTSGLTNMGNAMQVIGNNIANVNTVGFKRGRATFSDTLSQSIATQSGTGQVGRGTAIGSVDQNFEQGSLESTGNTTDLSIGGDGFFVLRQDGTNTNYYSRAGNFNFDESGQLVNAEGYIVQGWRLDDETGDEIGAIGDVVLEAFTSPPKQSSEVSVITNLDADAESKSVVLSNLWDSDAETYMEPTGYEYQTVVQVYDSLGTTHDVTIYYDKVADSTWEYIITCNPDEDNRNLVQNTASQGLLAKGTITFSQGSGDIVDFTMSEFTGRIGNLTASGVNAEDDINFTINNYESMSLDGYGFSLEFNGETWEFQDVNLDGTVDGLDLPDNYSGAKIVYSDDQHIEISLDGTDTNADITIKLAGAAVATDSFSFDINDPTDLHVQGLSGTTYSGETENDNTTLTINDASVMTEDSEGVTMIWYPEEGKWHWSNPERADAEGTLVTGQVTNNTGSVTTTGITTVTNAEDLTMISEDIQVRYTGAGWDWYDELKLDDITLETFTFSPTNNPTLSIVDVGSDRVIESATSTLTWDGAAWAASAGTGVNLYVVTSASDDTTVQVKMWFDGSSSDASTIEYNFGSALTTVGGQTIEFDIDPSPPVEYPNAVISSTGATDAISIDFDSDSVIDLVFSVTSGAAIPLAAGDTFTFDVNPDLAPEEYSDAVLVGDYDSVYIDLDGSGNDEDREDIVFTFTDALRHGSSADPYDDRSVISFDINGSTAWRDITTDEIQRTGYFSFMADFLGGDEGSTEMDIEFNIGTRYDGLNFVNDSLTTTQYSKSSTTTYQNADGYEAGDLTGVDVSTDGVITGIYSNGQLIPLFRVGLAKFFNNQGLNSVGGNLFSATRESGDAITSKPGENGLGTISPNSLEQSNVDIATEFVNMITVQRGFQANSKTITTVDDMMSTVIQMKR